MANTGDHGCQPLSIPRSAGGHIGSCQSHDANLHIVQTSPKKKPGHSHIEFTKIHSTLVVECC